jgi:hypothetical protein
MLHGCPPSPDAWGRLNVVTPFHHLSGDSHINSSLREGPLRHLGQTDAGRARLGWRNERVVITAAQLPLKLEAPAFKRSHFVM